MKQIKTHWGFIWPEINRLAKKIQGDSLVAEMVVGVSRGGLIPAAMLARQLNLPFVSIDPDEGLHQFGENCVVIMDDIFDTGDTLNKLFEEGGGERHIYCCLYNKNQPIDELHMLQSPDYAVDIHTDRWVVFPWESEDD